MKKRHKEYLRDQSSKNFGNDPFLFKKEYNPQKKLLNTSYGTRTGQIIEILKEPMYFQTYVKVAYSRGGKSEAIPWPGPNVAVTKSGSRGFSVVPHGLYQPPTLGWMVSVVYEEGEHHRPLITQTYPYNTDHDPQYEPMYQFPLTMMNFDSDDLILGHKSGSYIVIRGNVPVPGDIEFYTDSSLSLFSPDIRIGKNEIREQAVLGDQAITTLTTIVDKLVSVIDQLLISPSIITSDGATGVFNPAIIVSLGVIKGELNALKIPGQPLGTNSPILSTQVKISK